MTFRRIFVLACIVAFAVICGFAGYAKYNPAWGRYNVLVITLDTLRPDHLGAYGYKKIHTPNIDRLATHGTLFKNAFSQAPLTLPSHTAIFTSTYPPFNQVRDNGNNKLDESALTLAEILGKRGYDTAAFVSTFVLNARFGLNQGFQTYNDVKEEQDAKVVIQHMDGERTADKTTDAAIKWLRRKSPKPFFMWTHYYDPHSTYNPPPPFREKYKANPYDGEIAFADSQIGRLLAEMQKLKVLDKTLIIFTSDHGESLGEHKENGHAVFVYDTTLKVPLLIACPSRLPKGKIIEGQVRLVDLMPTILDFLKIGKPKKLQGTSLLPAVSGKKELPALDVYSESLYAQKHYNWSPLMAYRTNQWKLIRSSKPELYDIKSDPGEKTNQAQTRPDVVEDMDRRLRDFLLRVSSSDPKKSQVKMDDATREKLMSLGYIQGTPESGSKEPVPMEMIEVMEKVNLAVRQANQGMMEKAITTLKEALALDPNNVEIYTHLGQIHRELKQYDTAISYFKKALSFKPQDSKVHDGLGNIYKSMGRVEDAYQEFKKADELDPDNPSILNNLGWYHQQKLEIDKALEYYGKALKIDDEIATAHANRAICLRIKGQLPLAMQELKRAIELDKELAFAYAELGACLAMQGNLDAAAKACLQAIKLDPKGIDGYNNLGVIFQRKGQHEKALASFLKAVEVAPWNSLLYVNVGNAFLALKQTDKAREFYQRALQINPNDHATAQRLQQLRPAK